MDNTIKLIGHYEGGVSNHWNGIRTGLDWNGMRDGMERYGIAK